MANAQVQTASAPETATGQGPLVASRKTRMKGFLITSILSVLTALILFACILRVDLLDGAFGSFLKTVAWFKPLMALAAASPLFASLLIGYGYVNRAIQRKAREAAAQQRPDTPDEPENARSAAA